MKEASFHTGDILIKKDIHALMWVGGDREIVHNSMEGRDVNGVVRTIAGQYFKKIRSWQTYPLNVLVYRLGQLGSGVPARAATHAIKWATEYDINVNSDDVAEAVQIKIKSPLHGQRLLAAEKGGTQEFKVESLLRVIKAIARGETGLSPHKGTACSSFVTYCYQAAFLETFVGPSITGDVERILKLAEGRLGKITTLFGKTENLREDALERLLGTARQTLPTAMFRDAKTMHIEQLGELLDEEGSGFRHVGYVAYHNGETKMFTCAKDEEQKLTWDDVVETLYSDLT